MIGQFFSFQAMSIVLDSTTGSSIDLQAAQSSFLECAQHEADVLLAQAREFASKARDYALKAKDTMAMAETFVVQSQEPLFPLESCVDSDTEATSGMSLESFTHHWSDSSEGAYVTEVRPKPSKARRLCY